MPKRSDFTDAEWANTPEPIQSRILGGQSVSAIDETGGDASIWDLDWEVEDRLSREHMNDLRIRAAAADADVPL